MRMTFSKKMQGFGASIFSALNEKKIERLKKGLPVYNLSIGTPDFKPEPHIMQALSEAALDPENYKYAITDRDELIAAVQGWYKRRYEVDLESSEIMSLYGSQEGISRIFWALTDPGDVILAPDPAYPIFAVGPDLCGARVEYYKLYAKNNFILDFADIPEETARKARAIVVSYPSNPVCTVAGDDFYRDLIRFAEKYDIVVIHDNAYSDIIFDGKTGKSFLSYPGAKDVGIEINSLSKSYNVTGVRVSFAVGNKEVIEKFRDLRSQVDYGLFLPVQKMAVAALNGPQDSVKRNCAEYQRRRDALCGGLRAAGMDIRDSEGTMFAWGKIPARFENSEAFVLELIEKTGVICVPGSGFGSQGEGFARFALVLPVPKINELIEVIKNSGVL